MFPSTHPVVPEVSAWMRRRRGLVDRGGRRGRNEAKAVGARRVTGRCSGDAHERRGCGRGGAGGAYRGSISETPIARLAAHGGRRNRMNLYRLLQKRAADGRPVRVGL